MTALIVIGCILLFLILLLLCPVSVQIQFKDALSGRVRYLFFVYRIQSQEEPEEKAEKEIEKKAESKEGKNKIKDIISQRGLSGFLNLLKEIMAAATEQVKKLLLHVIVTRLNLDVTVATDDAAKTAVTYGGSCAVIYPAMSFLVTQTKCKKYGVSVVPDFDRTESVVSFELRAHIKLLFLVKTALASLKIFLKFYRSLKSDTDHNNTKLQKASQSKEQGGVPNERTSN